MTELNRTFPLDLLSEGSKQTPLGIPECLEMADRIIDVFEKKGIKFSKFNIPNYATSVLRFEFVPNSGVKIAKIRSCEDKLNEALSDYGPVRLITPVPANGTIAVEVPRSDPQIVHLKEVLESKEFRESDAYLPIALGLDSENNVVVADLAKMPHLMIAGAPGHGKSVLLNNIIISLLNRLSPVDLKLVLIDPKQVELTHFNTIKNQYLLQTSEMYPKVITEIEKVPIILNSIYYEVRYRYNLLIKSRCRTIYEYNHKLAESKLSNAEHHHLPYIIVVIAEFADLMVTQGRDFELPLIGIALQSRAVGIHVVIATQRPSSDTITGLIKTNFPSRIAFKVCSKDDSKIILDSTGAERLLGKGDMLLNYSGSINRIQSCFVDDNEIGNVCDWIKTNCNQPQPYQLPDTLSIKQKTIAECNDPLFEEAARYVIEYGNAKTSLLQRRFSIGYTRARILMDQLEAAGIVGSPKRNGQREVLKREVLKKVESNNKPQSFKFRIKRLLNLLKSENDKVSKDDLPAMTEEQIVTDKNRNETDVHKKKDTFDDYAIPQYKFPYADYKIVGDTALIDKIINTAGYLNIEVADITNTLSKDTLNYVTVGVGDNITDAFEQSVENLPIPTINVGRMLFQILIPNGHKPDINSMTEFISKFGDDIDLIWGIAHDESLTECIKVILIASSK